MNKQTSKENMNNFPIKPITDLLKVKQGPFVDDNRQDNWLREPPIPYKRGIEEEENIKTQHKAKLKLLQLLPKFADELFPDAGIKNNIIQYNDKAILSKSIPIKEEIDSSNSFQMATLRKGTVLTKSYKKSILSFNPYQEIILGHNWTFGFENPLELPKILEFYSIVNGIPLENATESIIDKLNNYNPKNKEVYLKDDQVHKGHYKINDNWQEVSLNAELISNTIQYTNLLPSVDLVYLNDDLLTVKKDNSQPQPLLEIINNYPLINKYGEIETYIIEIIHKGKVLFLPICTIHYEQTGLKDWHFDFYKTPAPLYNVNLLSQHPDAAVLLMSSVKKAKYIYKNLENKTIDTCLPVAWCGELEDYDLTPLKGRKVYFIDDTSTGYSAEENARFIEYLNKENINLKFIVNKNTTKKLNN